MMSATSATFSACQDSWMSVMIGTSKVSLTFFNTLHDVHGVASCKSS